MVYDFYIFLMEFFIGYNFVSEHFEKFDVFLTVSSSLWLLICCKVHIM